MLALLGEQNKETGRGGNNKIEYVLTIDAAKEISMMSQSERGKQARLYFIECEKKLKEKDTPSYQIDDRIKRAECWIGEEKERQRLAIENKEQKIVIDHKQHVIEKQSETIKKQKEKIKSDAEKVDFYDAVVHSKRAISMEKAAKILNFKDIGRNNLFKFLRLEKVLTIENLPRQIYIESKYFNVIEKGYVLNGVWNVAHQTVVFQKGLDFIRKLLTEKGYVQNEEPVCDEVNQ